MSYEMYKLKEKEFFLGAETPTQIVLHHTVGGHGAKGVVDYWNSQPGRVGTHFVVGYDGQILQTMEFGHWASHINTDGNGNTGNGGKQILAFEKRSIGIELCSWGAVNVDKYGVVWSAYKSQVSDPIVECDFRGFKHFAEYSDAQIEALYGLLVNLCQDLGIDHTKAFEHFELDNKANTNEWTIVSHTNFRRDKSDVFPSEKLIAMLNNLKYSTL